MRRAWIASLMWLVACGDDARAPTDSGPGDSGADVDASEPGDARDDDDGAEPEDAGTCRVSEDAGVLPAPAGRCTVALDEVEAHKPVGDDGESGFIVVGGRRVSRVGRTLPLPGFPLSVLPIPRTSFAVVSDGGVRDEVLSVVDLTRMEVVSQVRFTRRTRDATYGALFVGLAASSDGTRLFASGGGAGNLLVYTITAEGALVRDDARSTHFPDPDGSDSEYLSGLAYVEPSATVVFASMFRDEVVVWDVEAARELRRIALPEGALPYAVETDARGERVYVTGWASAAVYVIDPGSGTVLDTIDVGKNPEGLALSPDGTHLAVAASDGDSIAILDTTTRTTVVTIPIVGETAPRGSSPAEVAWSADGSRLFAACAGDNAIDVFDLADGGVRATHVGRIPTTWYPTDVAVLADGRVLALTGKHESTGPNDDPDEIDITDLIGGSLTLHERPDDASLSAWESEVAANNRRPMAFAAVECPDGASYDFPIPRPGEGPSRLIEHVVVIVRENKTYDAYFGDLRRADGAPHGNGEPALTLLNPAEMDVVLPNTRRLGLEFGLLDNFYSSGEQSTQGHFWTAFGRTTDFMERTYPTTQGRGYWVVPPGGILRDVGFPEEGSIFRWLERNGIDYQNYNELVASSDGATEPRIPGTFGNGPSESRDIERARWVGQRWVDECRMPAVSYLLLGNDHTFGGDPGQQTPRSMIADNDEAVGFVVDELSHSVHWPSTVIFVIEDDPQQGGDHVDNHRSPAFVVSPWVRRGHVSSVHHSEPSIWRTVQLILGIEEPPNATVEASAPVLDVFTSSPDFRPWSYTPRRWPEETNPEGTPFAIRSQAMDFSVVDRAEGLSRLLWEMLRGTRPPWPGGDADEDGDHDEPRRPRARDDDD
ncbi:MAG: bifunctional YncE family protein/alkaline phosphatase family protein [Deltaproteobacteria bacterium]|nr:bifunctional YncE family protein/alkaline phosphatase family protein [Deltaproteobacteria bacterium]